MSQAPYHMMYYTNFFNEQSQYIDLCTSPHVLCFPSRTLVHISPLYKVQSSRSSLSIHVFIHACYADCICPVHLSQHCLLPLFFQPSACHRTITTTVTTDYTQEDNLQIPCIHSALANAQTLSPSTTRPYPSRCDMPPLDMETSRRAFETTHSTLLPSSMVSLPNSTNGISKSFNT